jgi:hypothetical protein
MPLGIEWTTVNVVIRLADLEADRALLIHTLLHHLTPRSNDLRFDWLYQQNPHGQARVWIAVDTDNHAVVGMVSAFPRRMFVGGGVALAWVLGDFCIHAQYRSLGPALQLQRACLAEAETVGVAFCYDFPSETMMAIYKRLRINPYGEMQRLVKPLRVEPTIGRFIAAPRLVQGLSVVPNFLLNVRDCRSNRRAALTVSRHEGKCGEEFSRLAQLVGDHYGVCIERSSGYLNWRYRANPLDCYELFTARRGDALVGYAFVTQHSNRAMLVELFGIEERAVVGYLVQHVVAFLRQRGVDTVTAPMLASHPWLPLLRDLGFRPREARPVVVYVPSSSPAMRGLGESLHFFVMQGDRDS